MAKAARPPCAAPLRAGHAVRNLLVTWCALVDTQTARVLLAQRNRGMRSLRQLYELPGGKVRGQAGGRVTLLGPWRIGGRPWQHLGLLLGEQAGSWRGLVRKRLRR